MSNKYMQRWRKKQDALGKCYTCGRPKTRSLCEDCLEEVRKATLIRYRKKHGIPLDAPLSGRGRPRAKQS